MWRREFLALAGGLIAGPTLLAQSANVATGGRPKIMLFGLTVIRRNGQHVEALLPAVSNHGAFLVGSRSTAAALANGRPLKTAAGSGINEGHDDIGKAGDFLVCLPDLPITVGSGRARVQNGLERYLPNVPELAAKMQPGPSYKLGPFPVGTIPIALHGGELRMPGKKSNNVGTHDIPWRFKFNGNEVGPDYLLTDLLVFESDSSTLDVVIGKANATLTDGQRLWFVNIPTFAMLDASQDRIEHANDWFSMLNSQVNGPIEAVAKKPFTRRKGTTQLKHPCATPPGPLRLMQSGQHILYFPPDTDPCFIVSE